MSKGPFYITTPIYYPSDKLHIGHSYCTTAADAMARYKRLQGYDVMFLTGTDEHGQKIEDKAKEAGVTPKQFVDSIVEGPSGVKALWKLMNISNDRFIRTTDDYHVEAIQKIFRKMYEKGDIYKGVYKGKYCKPCESFWTESQLVDGCCPDCGRPVVDAEEEAYFFRLSKYADRVQHLLEDTDFLQPRSRVNEMVNNFIKPGLEDLCVSRTSFNWGIPVDFDPGHVVYVWVDALFNYVTALGFDNDRYHDYDKFWPADVHFVGKEIVRFHSIIWPAMLMSMELPLPKHVFGHGWLLIDGGKMSKSKGNVVDPYILAEHYGVDALRFFLLRTFPFGSDGNFSNEALISTINTDLANDLGNLVSRSLSMIDKYFGGTIPAVRQAERDSEENARLRDLLELREQRRDLHFESARIVESDTSNWQSVLTVNKGTAQDVAVGDCVVTEAGYLVGVVTEAGLNWSTVRTILDSDASIGATVFRSGQNAVAQGDFALMGQSRLMLGYLGASPDVLVGDLVVTSGLGGYYPPQLVIGTVESVFTGDDGLAQYAVVTPSMSLEDLTQVFVITSFDIVE